METTVVPCIPLFLGFLFPLSNSQTATNYIRAPSIGILFLFVPHSIP